ncbi:MAG: hypothetical protein QW767_03470 [Thermoprotei archaeon]
MAKALVWAFIAFVGYAGGVALFMGSKYIAYWLPGLVQVFTTSWFLAGMAGMVSALALVGLVSARNRSNTY